jgi:cell wall-associated NlpC family hydrolase
MATVTIAQVAEHCRRVALAGVRARADIHYTQKWPERWWGIQHACTGKNQPRFADCSAYTTWIFWWCRKYLRGSAGEDIVNGQDWKAGYTGTQLQYGRTHKQGVGAWYPGRTLVFYGKPTVSHVAIYVGDGMVVSHGSESGPNYVRWNYRTDFNRAKAYSV